MKKSKKSPAKVKDEDEEEKKISYSLPKQNELPPFDEFENGLCSWKPKLKKFIESKIWK